MKSEEIVKPKVVLVERKSIGLRVCDSLAQPPHTKHTTRIEAKPAQKNLENHEARGAWSIHIASSIHQYYGVLFANIISAMPVSPRLYR